MNFLLRQCNYVKVPSVMQKIAIKFTPVDIEKRAKVDIRAGDTVRVWTKIEEKGKTRLQPFEGLVLARKHGAEPGATFTVRKVASGVGVEKIFPLYSPMIDKIEVIKRAKSRRAKLYFIRKKTAKEIRRKMKAFTDFVTTSYEEATGATEEQKDAETKAAVEEKEAPTENVGTEEKTETEEKLKEGEKKEGE